MYVHCPWCDTRVALQADLPGLTIYCPGCSQTFQHQPPVATARELKPPPLPPMAVAEDAHEPFAPPPLPARWQESPEYMEEETEGRRSNPFAVPLSQACDPAKLQAARKFLFFVGSVLITQVFATLLLDMVMQSFFDERGRGAHLDLSGQVLMSFVIRLFLVGIPGILIMVAGKAKTHQWGWAVAGTVFAFLVGLYLAVAVLFGIRNVLELSEMIPLGIPNRRVFFNAAYVSLAFSGVTAVLGICSGVVALRAVTTRGDAPATFVVAEEEA